MQTNLLNTGNPANSSQSASQPIANATATSGISDMFTKLLVAQIQNQDPLSPTDPSSFVNQLAQLSQTEALQNMSTLTGNNASVLQSLQVLALGAQVGSKVSINTSSVKLDKEPVEGVITLSGAAARTTLVLTGADGVKHNVELGTRSAGEVPFVIDPSAMGLPAGTYSVQVDTDTGSTASVAVSGKLSSVKLSSTGNVMLNVANLGEVMPNAIVSFQGQPAPTITASN